MTDDPRFNFEQLIVFYTFAIILVVGLVRPLVKFCRSVTRHLPLQINWKIIRNGLIVRARWTPFSRRQAPNPPPEAPLAFKCHVPKCPQENDIREHLRLHTIITPNIDSETGLVTRIFTELPYLCTAILKFIMVTAHDKEPAQRE